MPRQDQGPIQIPLAVDLDGRVDINTSHNYVGDSQSPTSFILNGMVEVNPLNKTRYVKRRYGYEVGYIAEAVIVTAVKGFKYIQNLDQPAVIVGTSGNDYLDYDSIGYSLGIDAGSVGHYDMSYIESGGKEYIFIVGSVTSDTKAGYAWVFEPATTTLTRLVVGTHGFPDTTQFMARGAISLDTYAFVLTRSGRLYNSNVGDILTWTSTDFIDTNDAEDSKLYMGLHQDHIVVFGQKNITFYYDAGNPSGSPLAIRKDLTIPMGLLSSTLGGGTWPYTWSIDSDGEHICFVGGLNTVDIKGAVISNISGVYMIENFRMKKISTPYIDELLSLSGTSPGGLRTMLHTVHGRKLIIIKGNTFTSQDGSLVYDISTGYWYLWSTADLDQLDFVMCSGEFCADYNTGAIVKYTLNHLQDEYYVVGSGTITTEPPFTIQIPQISLGSSKNKFCRETTLVGDYSDAQQEVEISWTDDNYQNFSTARTYDLQYHRKLSRCGMFRKRAWKIYRDSNNNGSTGPIRLSHIEIDVKGAVVNTAD